jgi:hypothetical protein
MSVFHGAADDVNGSNGCGVLLRWPGRWRFSAGRSSTARRWGMAALRVWSSVWTKSSRAAPFYWGFLSLELVMGADSSSTRFPFWSEADSIEDKRKGEDFPMAVTQAQLRLCSCHEDDRVLTGPVRAAWWVASWAVREMGKRGRPIGLDEGKNDDTTQGRFRE